MVFLFYWTENIENVPCGIVGVMMLTSLKYKFARPWRTHTKWRRNQKTLRTGGQISETIFSLVFSSIESMKTLPVNSSILHDMLANSDFFIITLNMERNYEYLLELSHL